MYVCHFLYIWVSVCVCDVCSGAYGYHKKTVSSLVLELAVWTALTWVWELNSDPLEER